MDLHRLPQRQLVPHATYRAQVLTSQLGQHILYDPVYNTARLPVSAMFAAARRAGHSAGCFGIGIRKADILAGNASAFGTP